MLSTPSATSGRMSELYLYRPVTDFALMRKKKKESIDVPKSKHNECATPTSYMIPRLYAATGRTFAHRPHVSMSAPASGPPFPAAFTASTHSDEML
jgi:hypothetical protein